MADISDVSDALGLMIGGALYPSQPTGSIQASPIAGVPVKIEVGWPTPQSLDQQMKTGISVVSIYPRPTERNTTRYPQTVDQNGPLQTATFTLTQAGQVVSVGGAQPATFYGQNLAIFVNGVPYIVRTQASDTPNTIATSLAALIPSASASGSQITIPTLARIGALRVGTQAPTAQELKRQEREWQIIVWSPTPQARDAVARPIDIVIPQNKFLTLADGSSARLIYKGSPFSDFDQKQNIYRRDFLVTVEYATIAANMAPEVIAIETIYSQAAPNGSPMTPPILTTYT